MLLKPKLHCPKIFYPSLIFPSKFTIFIALCISTFVYVGNKDLIYLSMEGFQFEIYTKTELGVRGMQTERKKLN